MKFGNFLVFVTACLIIYATTSMAHGEKQPGPHGGHLRMPGAFHTELVHQGNNSFLIYLVDVHFKNPDALKSSLSVIAKSGEAQFDLNCKAESDRFFCKLPVSKNSPVKIDQLVLKAKYLSFPEGTSTYKLPLTFDQPNH